MKGFNVESAPWWTASLDFIGEEKMPIVLVDNFFPDPNVLTQDAKGKSFTANAPYFPGVRAPVPGAYFRPLMQGLSQIIVNIFQYKGGVDLQEAHYSLTTTAPENLNMVQRLPHVDGGNDMKLALLHYLCGPEHGGTSFYKQCRTGFETVSQARFEAYDEAVHKDDAEYGHPESRYFHDTDKRFEKIYEVDAKFNRAVMYFGLNLHAVTIGTKPLSTDPTQGRLTVNSFFKPL